MIAQALLEKGMLDSLAAGAATLVTDVRYAFQEKPWLWVVAAGVVFLVFQLRRR